MKKLFIITALLALTFIICSCTQASQKEIVPEFITDNETIDMDGYVFRIMQEYSAVNPLHYIQDTLFCDLLLARIEETSTALNCGLDIRPYTTGDVPTYVGLQIAAGLNFADIVYGGLWNSPKVMAMAGYTIPFDWLSDYIDLSDSVKFGPINLLEASMVDGQIYGIIPAAWPNKLTQGNIGSFVAFNGGIIDRYSMPDPRELHERGDWTTENFTKLMPDYYVMDGENEVLSFMAFTSHFSRAILGSCGMKLVAKKEGKWVPQFESPEVLDTIEWARDFADTNAPYVKFIDEYTTYDNLIRGETTLCVTESIFVDIIAKNLENFGILPFPNSPYINDGEQLTYFSSIEMLSIFASGGEPEASAMMLNTLLEPFPGYETEEDRSNILYKTTFYNQDDVDYFTNLTKTAIYQYFVVNGYAFMETIAADFRTRSASEIIASLSGTMDDVIEKHIAPNYEAIYG